MARRSALLTRTFLKASALATASPVLALRIVARRGLVGHDVIGGVDQKPIVAERFQDRGGLRRRLGREFADRRLGLGKLVVEKPRQRIVERVGARGAGEEEACEEREGAQRESKPIHCEYHKAIGSLTASKGSRLISCACARPHPADCLGHPLPHSPPGDGRCSERLDDGRRKIPSPVHGRGVRGEDQRLVSRRICPS